jgi:hypothetical protein
MSDGHWKIVYTKHGFKDKKTAIEPIAVSFAGVSPEYAAGFKEMMGVTYTYGGYTGTTAIHLLVLMGLTVLFFSR